MLLFRAHFFNIYIHIKIHINAHIIKHVRKKYVKYIFRIYKESYFVLEINYFTDK